MKLNCMKTAVFSNIAPCNLEETNVYFRGVYFSCYATTDNSVTTILLCIDNILTTIIPTYIQLLCSTGIFCTDDPCSSVRITYFGKNWNYRAFEIFIWYSCLDFYIPELFYIKFLHNCVFDKFCDQVRNLLVVCWIPWRRLRIAEIEFIVSDCKVRSA